MALIRPRITDYHGVLLTQEEADFAIPFLDEDMPFAVDPFLLWKSPSQQDTALHGCLIDSINFLGDLGSRKKKREAAQILVTASECNEVGLGFSSTRKGARLPLSDAENAVEMFEKIPQIRRSGFSHIEELQLVIDNFGKDRVSDVTCSILKSHLIDYTIAQCEKHGIPLVDTIIRDIFDPRNRQFIGEEKVKLPINPATGGPVLFVPKRWLKKAPWISSDDYLRGYFLTEILKTNQIRPEKGELLLYNRSNYGVVSEYIKRKELSFAECKNDPLFTQLPVLSMNRKLRDIKSLPTGKTDNADMKFEELQTQILASLFYPHLDFATAQSRSASGVQIKDLIFYNNRSFDFLTDIFDSYASRQIVFEMKNVSEISRDHVNQLYRYLDNEFGNFGVIVTRNPVPQKIFKNTIDLWSGKRVCILILDDSDISLMVKVFETRQRSPIEILKKKYIEFTQACPG